MSAVSFLLQPEVVLRRASIMAERPPSKDASPAASSKVVGNPALRMMGRSTVGGTSNKSRLINKI